MRVPGVWEFLLLALAGYRFVRLIGWDDFPPVARVRCWLIREYWVQGEEGPEGPYAERPLLAHFLHCPFCTGWWVSIGVYASWLVFPVWTLRISVPLALSGIIGLIAKNLDR